MKKPIVMFSFVFAAVTALTWVAQGQEKKVTPDQPRLPGVLRNVDLTEQQLKQVDAVTKRFRQELREIQNELAQIYTPEQRTARQEALKTARAAGKKNAQLRSAVDQAVKLSSEQTSQLKGLERRRSDLQKSIQAAYLKILTPEQQRRAGRQNEGTQRQRIAPTYANVSYGPHERNVMDVWIAKSDKPTPVLFSIHGGGFRGGNKGVDGGLLKACLDNGISVVAITYRLSQDAIAPAPFLDSARAVQFVRSKAKEWKLDKSRIASSGGSAGAGISLWLAFHHDLEDQNSSDPVRQESTRLKCAVVYNGQTTYDPREIRKLIPEADTFRHSALVQLYGVDLSKGLENIAPEKLELFEECSPITHFTKTDPPVLLAYATDLKTKITTQGIGIHHPRFGKLLKKKMDDLAVECIVSTASKRGSQEWINETMDFLKKHLVSQE